MHVAAGIRLGGAGRCETMITQVISAAALLPRCDLQMCGSSIREVVTSTPKGERTSLAFAAGGRTISLVKVPDAAPCLGVVAMVHPDRARHRCAQARGESMEHVLMKGLLWALFLPLEPAAEVELDVGQLYRPDVIALSDAGELRWWGECGSVTPEKLSALRSSFPGMRLTVAKWGMSDLSGYAAQLRQALPAVPEGTAPLDLVSFPVDSAQRFVADDGSLSVTWDAVETQEVELRLRKR